MHVGGSKNLGTLNTCAPLGWGVASSGNMLLPHVILPDFVALSQTI